MFGPRPRLPGASRAPHRSLPARLWHQSVPRSARGVVARGTAKEDTPAPSKIVRDMFDRLETDRGGDPGQEACGAGAQTSYAAFKRLDAAWTDMKTRTIHGIPPRTVRTTEEQLPATPGMDVVVAGGTLGVFLAMALQKRGLRTALLERGRYLP